MINNTRRKRGRPKGSTGSYFTTINLTDLSNHIGSSSSVVVSRKWLTEIGFDVKEAKSTDKQENKIQFTIE